MAMEESPKKLSPLFTVVFLIFGCVTAIVVFQIAQLWKIRHHWPTVTGAVTRTAPRGWWDEEAQWRYYLAYQYQVGETSYTGTRFHINERSIKKFTYLINNFKKGDPITVWYHPENPELAVINADYLRDRMALVIVLVGFLFWTGTMILKEKRWQRQVMALTAVISADYKGRQPLPSSSILKDAANMLSLNTGLSVFWSRGIPFLLFSFLSLFFMMLFLNEINPGWTLTDYLPIMIVSWLISFIAGFFVEKGFKKTLVIDAAEKKIKETSCTFFKTSLSVHDFSDIRELKLHRDQWHVTNTLKNWILYLHTKKQQSIFISFRHRDIQPAHKTYLETIKTRIEFLIFGGSHAKTR